MKCPSCGERLAARAERCPSCGAIIGPPLEGSLAPAPRPVTPPPRDREEPLRDIPGLRKRERTWRDEVRDRVRSRRQKRADAGLPLFDQPEVSEPSREAPAVRAGEEAAPAPPVAAETTSEAAPPHTMPVRTGPPVEPPAGSEVPELVSTPLSEQELADLPLRLPTEPVPPTRTGSAAAQPAPPPAREEDLGLPGEAPDDDEISFRPPPPAPEPLERPARPGERAQAAALDAGLLTVLGALVLYFTGRAARVDILSLIPSWPWLVAYLASLGLFYAGYFTGTTGQTPGKMITGLRVVDPAGRPPGYARAVLRAAAGALGTLLAGLGLLPIAFDPARRALHDRLLRTRVVHR